jgi:hypothetical protein
MRYLRLVAVGIAVVALLLLGFIAGIFPTVVGFAFGLAGALFLQGVVESERRARIAWVSRDLLTTEACFNLREIDFMDRSVGETLQAGGMYTVRSSSTGLRTTVLDRLISPEIVNAVSAIESGLAVEVLYELRALDEAFDTFFMRFEDRVKRPAQGNEPLDAALRMWNNSTRSCRGNLLRLLLFSLAYQTRAPFSDKGRALAAGTRDLRPVLRGMIGREDSDVAVVGASSELKDSRNQGWRVKKLLVCWQHDWPDCPIQVLALGPIAFPRELASPNVAEGS